MGWYVKGDTPNERKLRYYWIPSRVVLVTTVQAHIGIGSLLSWKSLTRRVLSSQCWSVAAESGSQFVLTTVPLLGVSPLDIAYFNLVSRVLPVSPTGVYTSHHLTGKFIHHTLELLYLEHSLDPCEKARQGLFSWKHRQHYHCICSLTDSWHTEGIGSLTAPVFAPALQYKFLKIQQVSHYSRAFLK